MSKQKDIQSLGKVYEKLAAESVPLYIAFVDLCSSTEFKQFLIENDLPHYIWLHRQLIFLQMVDSHLRSSGGNVVKTIGDEVMCTFDYTKSPEEIVHSLVELHLSLIDLKAFTGKAEMRAKASLDFGDTNNCSLVRDTYDPLGLCVDRCARLNGEANPGETVFSSDFNQRLHTKEKAGIHGSISEVEKCSKELRGLGRVSFYRVVTK